MSRFKVRPSYTNSNMDTPIKALILDKGDCYSNTCPVYRVEIDIDSGTAYYYGKKNIRLGTYSGKLKSYFLELLVDHAETVPFFKLANEYSSRWPDEAMTKISYVMKDGTMKTVAFDELAKPPHLIPLRLLIEYCLRTVVWKKV